MTITRCNPAALLFLLLAMCWLAQPAHANTWCHQDASVPARQDALPLPSDRAVFDNVLVRYVARSTSTPNEAAALANKLLWLRSAKFMPQPRVLAQGVATHMGQYAGPKWDAEEVALWEALVASSLDGASGYRVYVPTLAQQAFNAAWEVMMQRRMYVVYDCSAGGTQ